MNEDEIIWRARRGEVGAIGMLYQQHAARVFGTVRRLAGEDAQAEDWAQETWIRAIRGLRGYRGEASFTSWLHRIAVNVALGGIRAEQRRNGKETELEPHAPHAGTGLLKLQLEQALDRLPPGMRRVLVLHDVEGYTHQEIAGMLGIAPGTSKSQLFKARTKMRLLLSQTPANLTEGEVCRT